MLLKLKSVLAALAALAALTCSGWAMAQQNVEGDPARGRVLGETCLGCHAVASYRNAYPSFRVPKLAGQKAAYIVTALTAYRDGTRSHPTMHSQTVPLGEQEIADLAAWLSQAGNAVDDVDAQTPGLPESAVACIACHGTVGASMLPVPPVLSGQHRDYLAYALGQYQEQARGMVIMNSFAAGLTREQIDEITRFYSSREGLDTLDETQ